MNRLRILKRKEIDEQKWNELIHASVNSLPYALGYYLDAVAENWEALVLNDYEAAMPLVWLRKYGFKCLYQPYYCQQLGVFSREVLPADTMKEILLAAQTFPYININLNPSASKIEGDFSFKKKKNLLLDLKREYEAIRKGYSENHIRNIAKAEKNKFCFSEQSQLKPFQKFYLENVNREKENFKPKHEKVFKSLTQTLIANETAKIYAVLNAEEKMVAAVMLVLHQNRMISIINTSSAEGKKNGASHFLFDRLIHKFSATGNIFDFEGSSVAGIARFYEGFGAQEEVFYNYHTTIIRKLSQRFG